MSAPTEEEFRKRIAEERCELVSEWLKRLQAVGLPLSVIHGVMTFVVEYDDGCKIVGSLDVEPTE